MKRLIMIGLFLASPAFAQQQAPTQPITLSPQEYDALVSALAQRDPIISQLVQKQAQAQQAVVGKTAPAPAKPPEPAK
jgi:hypothetical protein